MTDDTKMTLIGPDGQESAPFTGDDLHRAAAQARNASKMKPDPEFDAAKDNAYRVTADELRKFIERHERLDAEKKDIADQQKEVMAEAKARGYDTKAMREVMRIRKRDADEVAEQEAVVAMYREVLQC